MSSWDNLEDAFKELDQEEYSVFSSSLHTYFSALQDRGFSRRESFRLIEKYADYIYNMAFEEYVASHMVEEESDEDDDVDTEEETE